MKTQSISRSRRFARSVSFRTFALFFASLMVASPPVIAQNPSGLPTFGAQVDSVALVPTESGQIGLKDVVKIIIEPGTNRVLLVGSKEDVAVVIRTLNSISERMKMNADPTVTEKVVLKTQLAETVASIMSSSLGVHNRGGPEVRINPVHFPEAILLSGPASAVKRAKELLETIDRY